MSFGSYLAGFLALAVALAACGTVGVIGRRRLVPGLGGTAALVAAIPVAVTAALLPALLLGSFGLLRGWSWLTLTVALAAFAWRFQGRLPRVEPSPAAPQAGRETSRTPALMAAVGLAIAAAAFGVFAAETAFKLTTGMSVFDTNWYHGPLAVEMARTGNTFALHHVAPAFLTWFYPLNSELLHGIGILIFGNDLLSPFFNLAWFGGCLAAAWAIGRPYGAAPVSLAGAALVLGSMAMADQAGEGRNDIVGAFFVLAGLAVLVNSAQGGRRVGVGAALVIALAAGLAAGTKLNLIPAAAILIGATLWLAVPGRRRQVVSASIVSLLLGGGYWYLKNLLQSGNPLPWIRQLGPVTLPGPGQEVGGREAGSVLGYLGDPGVIGEWFLPGLHQAFGDGWVVLFGLAIAGLVLCLVRGSDRARRAAAVAGFALFFAWLAAPTSASGSPGEPGGFYTGLRYVTPALLAGLALLGAGVGTRGAGSRWLAIGLLVLLAPFTIREAGSFPSFRYWVLAVLAAGLFWTVTMLLAWRCRGRRVTGSGRTRQGPAGTVLAAIGLIVVALVGQPVQRHYFNERYRSVEYATPGLAATFAWARGVHGERIGTTASRMYPLYGTYLENEVGFIGIKRPRGGFVRPESCRAFREAVNRGGYRYLVTAYDRLAREQDRPRESRWVAGDPAAREVLHRLGAVVFELSGPLDPAGCR